MLHRIGLHLRSNAFGLVAIFIALGGTTYAAIGVPRGSVGAAQLRNHAITSVKFNRSSIAGSVRAWAIIGADGRVIAGGGKPKSSVAAFSGHYAITWGVRLPRSCATIANVDYRSRPTETVPVSGNTTQALPAGYVSGVDSGTSGRKPLSRTVVTTFNQAGQVTPLVFDVAVIC